MNVRPCILSDGWTETNPGNTLTKSASLRNQFISLSLITSSMSFLFSSIVVPFCYLSVCRCYLLIVISVKFSIRQDTHTHTHTHTHTTHTHHTQTHTDPHTHAHSRGIVVAFRFARTFNDHTMNCVYLWCLWTSLHSSLLSAYSGNGRGNEIALLSVRPSDLSFSS
jgi:hypothetical protein